jgi:hypothetical protein
VHALSAKATAIVLSMGLLPAVLVPAPGRRAAARRTRGNDYNEHPTIVDTPAADGSFRWVLGDVQDRLVRQTDLVKLVRLSFP